MQIAEYKILLVDDDTNFLEVLFKIFRDAGYTTFTASDGYRAIEIARDKPIDLAILDFNLPDTDGIEVLKQIHKIRPDVPVIIMSADHSQSVQLDAFEAGAFTFLSKPISLKGLRYNVSKAIKSRSNQVSSGIEIRHRSVFIKWTEWIIRRK